MPTFAEIKTEVLANVIDTPSAIQTYVGNYVNRALRKLQVKHNFKTMESDQTYTTTFGTRVLGARPSDWKQPRGKPYYVEQLGGIRELHWTSSRGNALAQFGDSSTLDIGPPQLMFEDDLSAELNVYPYPDDLSDYTDGEYRLVVPYWKFLGKLISDGDENWFTTNAEQWLIYQATAEAYYANVDIATAQVWETRAAKEYKDVMLLDKDRRLAETRSLVPHFGAYMPHTEE